MHSLDSTPGRPVAIPRSPTRRHPLASRAQRSALRIPRPWRGMGLSVGARERRGVAPYNGTGDVVRGRRFNETRAHHPLRASGRALARFLLRRSARPPFSPVLKARPVARAGTTLRRASVATRGVAATTIARPMSHCARVLPIFDPTESCCGLAGESEGLPLRDVYHRNISRKAATNSILSIRCSTIE
jgi:hypothetical protein